MYLLRTNVSTKLIDNSEYIDALFGYDPDPATRADFRSDVVLHEEPTTEAEKSDKLRYIRTHKLSALKGSPGRSDTWTESEFNIFRVVQSEYGYNLYRAADEGGCLLRYSKLNEDGISITTMIVFADPDIWYSNIESHYQALENILQKHFILEGTTREISEEEYQGMVARIRADIDDMKSGGPTRCRLDFINEVAN